MILETDRLLVRQPRLEDTLDLYNYRESDFVLKYNAMAHMTKESYRYVIEMATKKKNSFVLELKSLHIPIGVIHIDEDSIRYDINSKELSFWIGEDYTNMGYMTEALKKIIEYYFDVKKVDVISARAFAENKASIALLNKLGFMCEGHIRRAVKGFHDVIYDDTLFSMLREDFDCVK